jgi:hypothetical protein
MSDERFVSVRRAPLKFSATPGPHLGPHPNRNRNRDQLQAPAGGTPGRGIACMVPVVAGNVWVDVLLSLAAGFEIVG